MGLDRESRANGRRTRRRKGAAPRRDDDCTSCAHIHDSPLPLTWTKWKRWAQIQTTTRLPPPPPTARRRLLRPPRLSQLWRLPRQRRRILLPLRPVRSQLPREQHRLQRMLLLRPAQEPERARRRAATVTLPRRQTSNATRTSCSGQRRTRWSIWRSLTNSWKS